ncbi:hypothetical protein [Burkholderia cenocepacia]|uniref:hypothetical protein n=1 Tax=Burkholderia cenocepacia TaxID=95486 RepID=UPI00264A665D|nr:hypothetical protein [Burkholderia cenocepacia]MDN7684065.1 hypothetical protein [Burkholderia cenocepacia]
MDAQLRKEFGLDETVNVVYTGSRNESRKGEDTDITSYDVFDVSGQLIAKCEVRESMGIYPPHKKRTVYRKYSPAGVQV